MPAPGSFTPDELDDAIERYLAGEGRLMAIAQSIGIGVPRFKREMAKRGIAPRTRSEAQAMRHVRDAGTEWHKRFRERGAVAREEWVNSERNRERMRALGSKVGPANAGRVTPASQALQRAKTHRQRVLKVSPLALELQELLAERGLTGVIEQECGRYNIDIAVPPVAVEVHRYSFDPLGTSASARRLRKRAHYICNRGWSILYVWANPQRPGPLLSPEAADDIAAWVEVAKGDPSRIGEYRVIRGSGEFVSSGRPDGDDWT